MTTSTTTLKPKRTRKAPTRAAPARQPKPAAENEAAAAAEAKGLGTGAVIGVAAAGIAAGLVANLGRKAAVQAPSALAGDWLELVKAEHKLALGLIDRLEATDNSNTWKRTMLLTQLKHALGKHAFMEENVLYPALREAGEREDADHLAHDQSYHKQYLYELDNCPKDSPDFLVIVGRLRAALEPHMKDEEDNLFAGLHARLGAERNKALTLAANKEGFKLA